MENATKLVCSLIPDILETIPKEKIVALNKPAEKSQTTLPTLGADLGVHYERTLGSLDREAFQALKTGLVILQA